MNRVITGILLLFLIGGCLLQPSIWYFVLIFVLIFIPLISLLLSRLRKNDFDILIYAPTIEKKNQTFKVTMDVVDINPDSKWKFIPVGGMKVRLQVKNVITGEETTSDILLKNSLEIELRSVYSGALSLKIMQGWMYDWLGVFSQRIRLNAEKKVVIMPEVYPAYVEEQLHYSTLDDCQEYSPDKKGQDRSEIFQIRDYVPGDPINQIHWKLSGKWDSLIVRDASFPLDRQMMLFVDQSYGKISYPMADAIMEAAISVGTAMISAGMPFCLMWNNEQMQSRNITDEEEWYSCVGELLNVETHDGPAGTVDYVNSYGVPREGRVIYIGGTVPENMDEFCSGAFVEGYIGTEKALELENFHFFTPQTLPDVLANPE